MRQNFLASAALCTAAFFFSVSGATAQTIDLFNGKDLSNWEFVLENNTKKASEVFTIKDGLLHITGTPFGYMSTKDTYSNFHLHVEWRYPYGEATNSGIFLFVQDDKKVWPNAIECNLQAGGAGTLVLLGGSDIAEYKAKPGEKRPAFPKVDKLYPSAEMPTGEWNNANITCHNGNITIYINGVLMNKGTKSGHKSGHIALQSEGKDIQFRNIRVTPEK